MSARTCVKRTPRRARRLSIRSGLAPGARSPNKRGQGRPPAAPRGPRSRGPSASCSSSPRSRRTPATSRASRPRPQSPLHLVGRLGFRIDENAVRRAGLDYWHLVELEQHLDLSHFCTTHTPARGSASSARWPRGATSTPASPPATRSSSARRASASTRICSPATRARCSASRRSAPSGRLNLANAVSIVLYEALRQVGALAAAAPG